MYPVLDSDGRAVWRANLTSSLSGFHLLFSLSLTSKATDVSLVRDMQKAAMGSDCVPDDFSIRKYYRQANLFTIK